MAHKTLPVGTGARIGWVQGSVLSLPFAEASHTVVLCQLGLQFVPDRPTALAQIRRVLMPGGRLGLNVYGPIEHNPATFALAQALDRHLGPDASMTKRAEHALADAALLRTLAAEASFKQIKIVTETRTVRFASVSDYVRIQLTATPLASLLQHPPGGLAGDWHRCSSQTSRPPCSHTRQQTAWPFRRKLTFSSRTDKPSTHAPAFETKQPDIAQSDGSTRPA